MVTVGVPWALFHVGLGRSSLFDFVFWGFCQGRGQEERQLPGAALGSGSRGQLYSWGVQQLSSAHRLKAC